MKNQFLPRLGVAIPTALLLACFLPSTALAVPPPDFIFAAGAQLVQVFAAIVVLGSAAFSVSFNYFKTRFILIKSHKYGFVGLSLAGILLVSLGLAYGYNAYQEQKAYNDWLEESQRYTQLSEERVSRTGDGDEERVPRLEIGSVPGSGDEILNSDVPFISNINGGLQGDPMVEFIEKYYESIAIGDLDTAYALSKQSVSADTFKGWYSATTQITLDDLTKIDDETSSLELTLYEDDVFTRYGVLMGVRFENGEPVQVASSTVKVLSEGSVAKEGDEIIVSAETQENEFYSQNQDIALSTSNEEFQVVLDSGDSDYIVLDAREDLEYENGYFPGSLHIRFADLQAGRWIEIPEDKVVYVICWSGIRGQEVAEFLRTKNIVASYLVGGASEWVAFGGEWIGNINFAQKYTEERYRITYTTDQVKEYVAEGVVLVDTREPWRYDSSHIEGSINIPIMYTATVDLEEAFGQVPANSTVITVCDDYVNCFDAKITGTELEDRGHTFIGRYNSPWEY